MTVDTRPRPDDGTNIPAQMLGLLLAPTIYLAGQQLAYQMVPHDCLRQSSTLGHLIHGGIFVLCLVGAFIGWSVWQQHGIDWPDEEAGPAPRSRFLGAIGTLMSLLFALIALAQWLATFFLSPCQ